MEYGIWNRGVMCRTSLQFLRIFKLDRGRLADNPVQGLRTLHPTPYTLHPTPYNLHLTPYTLHRGLGCGAWEADERGGGTLKDFMDFHPEARARI